MIVEIGAKVKNCVRIQFRGNIFLSIGMCGSSKGRIFEQCELESKYRPRFGRNWWYWFPELRSNGGKFRHYENTDINFHWFCFWISFTVYSWKPKSK